MSSIVLVKYLDAGRCGRCGGCGRCGRCGSCAFSLLQLLWKLYAATGRTPLVPPRAQGVPRRDICIELDLIASLYLLPLARLPAGRAGGGGPSKDGLAAQIKMTIPLRTRAIDPLSTPGLLGERDANHTAKEPRPGCSRALRQFIRNTNKAEGNVKGQMTRRPISGKPISQRYVSEFSPESTTHTCFTQTPA